MCKNNEKFIVKSPYGLTEIPSISVGRFINEQFMKNSKSLAVIDGRNGMEYDYESLNNEIRRQASKFISIGIGKNDLVLMFADNSFEYLVSFLALMYLGVTFSPSSSTNGCFELGEQIENSKATVVWIDQKHLSIFKKVMKQQNNKRIDALRLLIIAESNYDSKETFSIDDLAENFKVVHMKQLSNHNQMIDRVPYFETEPNDPLVIIYTSGSTGLPKGAIHTQTSALASTMIFRPYSIFKQQTIRYLMWYPFAHISGILGTLKILCWSQTLILTENCRLEHMLMLVERFQANQMPILPNYIANLAKNNYHQQFRLESLKVVSCAGAKVPHELFREIEEKYHVKTIEVYGSTEMMGSVMIPMGESFPVGTVGVPQTNIEMKIIDIETKENLPPGSNGEICFRGPALFAGYLMNEKATNETIDSNGWYHTGDIGYYNSQGYLFVVDRIKLMIKYRQWSVSPVQIESFLLKHASIENVCVVGVRHVTDGHLLRAYIQLKHGRNISVEDVKEFTKNNMSDVKQLRGGIRFVDRIKCTFLGKIDRQFYQDMIKNEVLTDSLL